MPDTFFKSRKVSIIIPTLNEEKLLKNLLLQFENGVKDKFDLEVIVSDGGSKDKTIEIANRYADKVLVHNKDISQNISRGRNEGARNSQGDVLIFLNADTLFENLSLILEESLKEIFINNVSAIACPIYVFPSEEKLSDKCFHIFYNNYTDFLVRYLMGMGRGECHIIKRDKFFDAGEYNEDIAAGEDFDLYMRLKKNGKIIFRKDFIVYESPRRYRNYGYLKLMWEWGKNSASVYLLNKSVSKKWEEVR